MRIAAIDAHSAILIHGFGACSRHGIRHAKLDSTRPYHTNFVRNSSMLCQLHIKNRFLRQAAWRCCRLQVSKAHSGSYPHGFSGDGVHHEWRVRLFDSAHGRSYAIDLGHFPGRWFLGPSASVAFSRSDNLAGRPHSFRVSSKQLEGLKSSGTDLSLGTNLAVEEDFGFTVSDTEFSLVTQAYGALLSIQSTSAHAERQLSRTTALLQGDMSCLKSQALRSEVYNLVMHATS